MAFGAQHLLVVGPAWVGDMVMAQSLYRYLKEVRPKLVIDVLAPDWSLPLLQRMPEVDQAIRNPLGHGQLGLMARYRLGRSLRKNQYDWAIVLPRSFKAALVPFFAGIPYRTGYLGEMRYGILNDIRHLDKEKIPSVFQRYATLGLSPKAQTHRPPNIPCPKLTIDEANRDSLVSKLALHNEKPVAIFAPGAEYGSAKQWPIEHFATLAKSLYKEGFQIWQLGSKKDHETAQHIHKLSGELTVNLCGQTELVDTIDLLSLGKVLVTNDSGLMHVGAAVDIPVVAIYGSTSPLYTPPLTAKKSVLHLNDECSPCFQRECPGKHTRCLSDIEPEQAYHAVMELTQPQGSFTP